MNLLYNPDELRQGASQIENYMEEIKHILSSIDSEINQTGSQWEGLTKDGFMMNYENSKQDQKLYIDCIMKIIENLRHVANTSETSENHFATMFRR